MLSLLILGAGWVGRQIAAQAAGHGIPCFLHDVDPQTEREAVEWARLHIADQVASGAWKAVSNEVQVQAVREPLQDPEAYDVVLECVPEEITLKRKLLMTWSERTPASTILASNSSYFVPSWLSTRVRHPERYAHWHFHVPVWIATIVDIVPGPETCEGTLERLEQYSRRMGQTPILQRKENPGYLFNWMLRGVLLSALQLYERQIADPKSIDLAWCGVSQMPIGPFGIMDQIGLDVVLGGLRNSQWHQDGTDPRPLLALLEPLVAAGHLGVKSGRGFYDYASLDVAGDPNQVEKPNA